MEFRNISPSGDLDIVGIGRVPAGGTFEAVGDAAQQFIDQPGNFERVDKPRKRRKPAAPVAPQDPPTEGDQL